MTPTDEDFSAILKQARATLYRIKYDNSRWVMFCTGCGVRRAMEYELVGPDHAPGCVANILRKYECQTVTNDTST